MKHVKRDPYSAGSNSGRGILRKPNNMCSAYWYDVTTTKQQISDIYSILSQYFIVSVQGPLHAFVLLKWSSSGKIK